jgi:hypothetical protein
MRDKGREIVLLANDSKGSARLQAMGKEASVLMCAEGGDYISLMENPSKIAALEEFLHGTQRKIASFSGLHSVILEIEVKDFMIRHSRLLGLSDNDLAVLNALKQGEIEEASRHGFRWIPW